MNGFIVFTHLSTDVEELRTVERLLVMLLYDEDLVVEILLSQVIVDVAEELLELTWSVAIRNDDCSGKARITFFRPIFT